MTETHLLATNSTAVALSGLPLLGRCFFDNLPQALVNIPFRGVYNLDVERLCLPKQVLGPVVHFGVDQMRLGTLFFEPLVPFILFTVDEDDMASRHMMLLERRKYKSNINLPFNVNFPFI
jgi:hypothetical protein